MKCKKHIVCDCVLREEIRTLRSIAEEADRALKAHFIATRKGMIENYFAGLVNAIRAWRASQRG